MHPSTYCDVSSLQDFDDLLRYQDHVMESSHTFTSTTQAISQYSDIDYWSDPEDLQVQEDDVQTVPDIVHVESGATTQTQSDALTSHALCVLSTSTHDADNELLAPTSDTAIHQLNSTTTIQYDGSRTTVECDPHHSDDEWDDLACKLYPSNDSTSSLVTCKVYGACETDLDDMDCNDFTCLELYCDNDP